jgi:hypothetical protein
MLLDPLDLRWCEPALQEGLPIGNQVAERLHPYEVIILATHMGSGTAPWVGDGVNDEAGPDGIELDVAGGREEMPLVHHEGRKSLLPEMPPPAFAEIDPAGIPPVRFA